MKIPDSPYYKKREPRAQWWIAAIAVFVAIMALAGKL